MRELVQLPTSSIAAVTQEPPVVVKVRTVLMPWRHSCQFWVTVRWPRVGGAPAAAAPELIAHPDPPCIVQV